jgi:hypothetical protein
MQGTQNNTTVVGGAVDLDALLADRLLDRVPVVLGGRTWKIRTDLTGTEVVRSLGFYNATDLQGLFTLLFGTREEVAALNAALDERKRAEELAAEARKQAGGKDTKVTYAPLPYAKRGVELAELVHALPKIHSALATAHIFRASKALHEFALDDDAIHRNFDYTPPGESSAS